MSGKGKDTDRTGETGSSSTPLAGRDAVVDKLVEDQFRTFEHTYRKLKDN